MNNNRGHFSKFATFIVLIAILGATACSSDSEGASFNDESSQNNGNSYNNGGGGASQDAGSNEDDDFVPEQEEDFEFSAPAVVGEHVYVANETLNSVAVIDSRNLSISTRLVGFRPTEIVGPDARRAESGEDPRVMVLNEGSNSVSILETGGDPATNAAVKTVPVMAHANQIAMEPTGRAAVVWYDPSKAETGDGAGDLSSVSVIRDGQSFQISVGFHVRTVSFDDAGTRALVLSDDGLSVIELADVDTDAIALPMPVVPEQFSSTRPEDLEVLVTHDGKWAITRSSTFGGVVLLDVDSGELHLMAMPEVPTDIDLIEGQQLEVLIMLRNSGKAVRATIPDGFRDAAEAMTTNTASIIMRSDDVGYDAGFPQDVGYDAGTMADIGYDGGGHLDTGYDVDSSSDAGPPEDVSPDGSTIPDAEIPDTDWDADDITGGGDAIDVDVSDFDANDPDANDPDATGGDVAISQDTTSSGDADASDPSQDFDFPSNINGFSVVDLMIDGMGAAVVSAAGNTALLYSTLNQEKRALLYDLDADPSDEEAQRALAFEKGVRGALSDRLGNTLLVFHSKLDGPVPPETSPADPEYIAHSWGVSVVDVESGATRLVLSKNEPGQAVLSSPELDEDGDAIADAKIFMVFKAAQGAQASDSALRDVLTVNLRSFRTDSFRVPSLPEGLGLIRDAGRVYISQHHPQGRMTFVDVVGEARQTITGYQLNAGID